MVKRFDTLLKPDLILSKANEAIKLIRCFFTVNIVRTKQFGGLTFCYNRFINEVINVIYHL